MSFATCGTEQSGKIITEQKLHDLYGNEFQLPDNTIKDIRDSIPKHCFERSSIRGFSYVARDLSLLAGTFWVFNTFCTRDYVSSMSIRLILWLIYTFAQGCFATGLWVLAHECGHQAFSSSQLLNDSVGFVCHSALLVPYFSWKITHRKHHQATGSMERDMAFVPYTREEYAKRLACSPHQILELIEETPIYTLGLLIFQQLVGWQLYLLTNTTRNRSSNRRRASKPDENHQRFHNTNHFDPRSKLFARKEMHLVLLSDLGLAVVGVVLFLLGRRYGWVNLLVWYGIPYVWVHHWLVAFTYLHHTDPSLPHYVGTAWNFTRGAAATIDRDFGFIGRHLFHRIIETHVLHHHVSTIPFYHAEEATSSIKAVMGQHYRSSTETGPLGFLTALWKSARWCQWVEPNAGSQGENAQVLFFRNRNKLGVNSA